MSYEDIIHEHRPSPIRKRMTRSERAKIFMPFAALKGYEEATAAREDVLTERIELSEERQSYLNDQLTQLEKGMPIRITYFQPETYNHGHYVKKQGKVKKIDTYGQLLVINQKEIRFADLYDLNILTSL